MTRPRVSDRAGFTLVELMVTVAIVGVIAALAAVAIRQAPTPVAARRVQVMFGEARRLAVAGGPIRPDVRAALGIVERTRIEISHAGDNELMEMLLFEEDPVNPTGVWVIEDSFVMDPRVAIAGVATVVQSEPGGPAPPALPASAPAIRRFFSDGTADAATVFLSDRRQVAGDEDPYRVTVTPLSGASSVLKGW